MQTNWRQCIPIQINAVQCLQIVVLPIKCNVSQSAPGALKRHGELVNDQGVSIPIGHFCCTCMRDIGGVRAGTSLHRSCQAPPRSRARGTDELACRDLCAAREAGRRARGGSSSSRSSSSPVPRSQPGEQSYNRCVREVAGANLAGRASH